MSDDLEVVARVLEVFSGDMAALFRDPEALAAARVITDRYFDPDVVTVLPEGQAALGFQSGEIRGVEALVGAWMQFLEVFEGLENVYGPPRRLADGRVVSTSQTTVRLSTGQAVQFNGGGVWELEEGRVVRVWFAQTKADLAEIAGEAEPHA